MGAPIFPPGPQLSFVARGKPPLGANSSPGSRNSEVFYRQMTLVIKDGLFLEVKPCGFGISARCHLSLKILLDSIQLPTLLGEVKLEITQMKAISFYLQNA